MGKPRNYKKEYRDFHGKPDQIKNGLCAIKLDACVV